MSVVEEFRLRIHYDPDSGKLHWKKDPQKNKSWNTRYAGKEVGCVDKTTGYICFSFTYKGKKRRYLAHRAAFAIYHGNWPREIDHINGNRTDNTINNLRECSSAQNKANRRAAHKSATGVKGVTKARPTRCGKQRYIAQCRSRGRNHYLGTYETIELAKRAYSDFAKKEFGEYFCV